MVTSGKKVINFLSVLLYYIVKVNFSGNNHHRTCYIWIGVRHMLKTFSILVVSELSLKVFSHCVADIRDSRREVARTSELTVHTTKCGVAVVATWNVNKHVRSIERMTMSFKCFFLTHTTLNIFFCPLLLKEISELKLYLKNAENLQE